MHRSLKARLAAAPIACCALILAAHAQTFHGNTVGSDFKSVFRDYTVDGVPSSGAHPPVKSEIRSLGIVLDSAIRFITPQNFGAACDGVTNDTTALQNWAAAFTANSEGYVPVGVCLTTGTLTFPSVNAVKIFGGGSGAEIRYVGGATGTTLLSFGTSTGGCSFSEWDISGFIMTSTTLMNGGDAVVMNDGCHVKFHHVVVANNAGGSYGNWWNGLEVKGGNQVEVDSYSLTGQGTALILEGDTAGHGSTQLTDPRIGKGIIIGGAYGINIAGNVGGAVISGPDDLLNGTQIRISQDNVAIPNKQIVIGGDTFVDATSGGVGVGIDVADTGSTGSILMLKNVWLASATTYCLHFAASTQWVLDMNGGQMINCTVDGFNNQSTSLKANINGVTVGNMSGFVGFSGYGFNCVASNLNVTLSNIKFVSSVGTSEFSPNCNPASFSLPGSNAVYSKAPFYNYIQPTTAWQYDITNQVATTIANGANVALPVGSGMITVSEGTGGSTATYNCGGAACVLLGTSTATWVASTTSPAAGKLSVAYNGSTAYAVYNNQGASENVNISLIRTKATN